MYKNSPLKKQFEIVYNNVHNIVQSIHSGQKNELYHPKIIEFILNKYIAFLPF